MKSIKNKSRAVLYTALLNLVFCANIIAQTKFELSGKAAGLNNSNVILIAREELRKADTLGTAVIKNGVFKIDGKIKNPVMAQLMFSESNRYSVFWLMPGKVEIDLDTARVSENSPKELVPIVKGSKEQDIYSLYTQKTKILSADLNREYKKMSAMKDPEEKKKQEEKVSEIREEYTKKSQEFLWDFAKEHNNSFAASFLVSYAINDSYVPLEKIVSVMNNFTEDVKTSKTYKKNSEELASLLRIQPGKPAPDFTLKDVDGNDLSLSSLKGKVVMIDFWASWCVPCVASIPSMKELYNKYKEKGFEILGVTNDTKEDAWKKCIEKNSIPWKNVIDRFPKPPAPFGPAEVITLYACHYLPTTILLDKNGIIIAKNLHDKELEEKIIETLK